MLELRTAVAIASPCPILTYLVSGSDAARIHQTYRDVAASLGRNGPGHGAYEGVTHVAA